MHQFTRQACGLMITAGVLAGVVPAAAQPVDRAIARTEAADRVSTTTSLVKETIFTSNALENATQLSDRIQRLRGTIDVTGSFEEFTLGINAAAEANEYRLYDFQSDRSARVGVSFARSWGDGLTLRGAVNAAFEDRGDHLDLGVAIVGFRTPARTLGGDVEATVRLSETLSATASFSQADETLGKARFTIDVDDLKLNPDNRRRQAAFGLARTTDVADFAVIARIGSLRATDADAFQAILASRRQSVALRGQTTSMFGMTLAAEIGLEQLRDGLDLANAVYPIYDFAAERTFQRRTAVKLRLKGFIDTIDSDDPLASYAHRGEIELTHPLPGAFTASAGLFAEWRENIAIGNHEDAWGAYGALAYSHADRLTFLLRLDYDERRRSLVETRHHTLAARFGLQLQL